MHAGSSRRWWHVALLVAAAAAMLVSGWVGIRTTTAVVLLQTAFPTLGDVDEHLTAGDEAALADSVETITSRTAAAAALTSDPVYRALERIPVLGHNLLALRTLTAGVDAMASGGLAPLVPLVSSLDPASLIPSDGRVDLRPFRDAAPHLRTAASSITAALDDITRIDGALTIAPVNAGIDAVTALGLSAFDGVTTAANAAELLPKVLGDEGDRNYLLVFQNNAELRATGGVPGALALIRTSQGRFDLTMQASAQDFPRYPTPVLPIDQATRSLYRGLVATKMQNVTSTPHFPESASLAAEMWRLRFGDRIDGVVALDPVTLGYLLRASGPVKLSTGDTLKSFNAATFLLSKVYSRYPDPEKQDVVFADAARAVFDVFSDGASDPVILFKSLRKASEERRILIWSARSEEQALLAGTTFAGTLPETNLGGNTVGVFFNDATGGKMDFYLSADISAGIVGCGENGARTVEASVAITSDAPADAATSLPEYVTAHGNFGVQPGTIRTRVVVYGPVGSTVAGVSVGDDPSPAQVITHLGRGVAQVVVDLRPGESERVGVSFAGMPGSDAPPVVQATPLIGGPATRITSSDCGVQR